MTDVTRILSQIESGDPSAAEAMRRILIERARQRRSLKRGGDQQRGERVEIEPAVLPLACDDLRELDEALYRLEQEPPPSGAGEAALLHWPDHRTSRPVRAGFHHNCIE